MGIERFFIATVSDGESESGPVKAIDILNYRLSNSIWASYHRSKGFKRLKIDSKLLFYVGGKGENSQSIIAKASIEKIINKFNRSDLGRLVDLKSWFYDYPEIQFELKNIKIFDEPIDIKLNVPFLEIYKSKDQERWWLAIQGGFIEISKNDYIQLTK